MSRRRQAGSVAWAAAREAASTAEALTTMRQMAGERAVREARARRVVQLTEAAQAYQNMIIIRAQELRLMALSRKDDN